MLRTWYGLSFPLRSRKWQSLTDSVPNPGGQARLKLKIDYSPHRIAQFSHNFRKGIDYFVIYRYIYIGN